MTELQHTSYYPFGGIIADTFLTRGRDVQNRTYNGKEQDFSNSLFWLDYGARHYDPTRGQFTTYDPHCERYYNTNPLTYCNNNAVNAVDPDGRKVFGIDAYARKNIQYTLTASEAQYVSFESDGSLDVTKLMQCESSSRNFTALLTLAKSETNYIFMVSDKDINGTAFYEKGTNKKNPSNYSYGVTNMPGAENDPSPNNNVYIYTYSSLDEKRQVRNTAHEGYGHAYFYELSKRDPSINPNHTKGLVGYETVQDPDYGPIFVGIYGNNNNKLEEQIKKAEQEAIWNYESR